MIFFWRHGCRRTRFNRLATRGAKRVDERRLARVGEAYDEQTTLRSVCGEERVFFSQNCTKVSGSIPIMVDP